MRGALKIFTKAPKSTSPGGQGQGEGDGDSDGEGEGEVDEDPLDDPQEDVPLDDEEEEAEEEGGSEEEEADDSSGSAMATGTSDGPSQEWQEPYRGVESNRSGGSNSNSGSRA